MSAPANISNGQLPTAFPAPMYTSVRPSPASPYSSTGAAGATAIPTSTPSEFLFPSTVHVVRATMGDAAITNRLGRRAQVTIKMAFRPILGANEYRMELRMRVPETVAESASLPTASLPNASGPLEAPSVLEMPTPAVDQNSTPPSNGNGLLMRSEHRRRASPASKPSGPDNSPGSKPSSPGIKPSSPGDRPSSGGVGSTLPPRPSSGGVGGTLSPRTGQVGPLTPPPAPGITGTGQGDSHEGNSTGKEEAHPNDDSEPDLASPDEQGPWAEPNATAMPIDRAYVSWAPLLGTFPREGGGSLVKLSWTDVNYSTTTEFYTLWFRDIDSREGEVQQLRCLTSNEDVGSVGRPKSLEDSCGEATSAGDRESDGTANSSSAQRSTCHPFWVTKQEYEEQGSRVFSKFS